MKSFTVRFPDELLAEIKEKAWEQKKSMNQYIIDCVECSGRDLLDNTKKILDSFRETPVEECKQECIVCKSTTGCTCTTISFPEKNPEKKIVMNVDKTLEAFAQPAKKKCKKCSTKTSNFVIRNGKEIYVCDNHLKTI